MIVKIDNKSDEIAVEIRRIFQASYVIEAKMLKAIYFPPLKRTISQFIDSKSKFYAYYIKQNIAGLIEISSNKYITHIQSLVIYPNILGKELGGH